MADHVATITFTRPEKLNAFRAESMRQFIAALDRVDADDDGSHVVVVTGEGRAFCAGADISGGAQAFQPVPAKAGSPAKTPRDGGGILALRIYASTKPVIGAINGAAVMEVDAARIPAGARLGIDLVGARWKLDELQVVGGG